ncbi:type II secretion system secretin GspD [Chitinimonas koreensis]|uniref:type II secretion system secretin GspD n=1 Tax=Chitinimonas koreensis TaxID=356302 RepID=UPI00042207A4|nr:type II secretion system secretin GspD [Chitinimonas koreensis]QNM98366.1 type II secretion system secretin GspD [Chitinimonas koreensis]
MKKLKTLALAVLLAGQVMAADDKVMLNFVNSDIESTVKAVGLITGKNFVLDPRVKGTVNIVSSSPVARGEVYEILLSALRLQGFAVVETAGAVRVVPEADAKQNYGLTVNRKLGVGGDRIITQVYPLKHESAAQLVPILRPLITPNNSIAAYPGSNVLVITDYADNVRRLNQIVANIDQPAAADLVTLPLKYASAVDVAQMIGRLMPEVSVSGVAVQAAMPGAQLEGVRKTALVADVRANTLIVRGDNPAHLAQIRKIAEGLDQPGAAGGNIHVIYLKNADATKLAATLKAILTGGDVPQTQSGSFTSVTSSGGAGGTGGVATPSAPASSAVSLGGSGGGQVAPGVAVQADPTTNALIVTAPDNVYNNLRSVIDKLDVRRAQVYVEAMIAEVSVDRGGEFGIQWLLGGGNNSVNGVGMSNLGSAASGTSLGSVAAALATKSYGSLPAGLMLGVVNGSLSGDGKQPTLGAIATAIESHGDGNVLSTPNLLTLDNEEASMIVGQNIPIVTGTQSSTGSNQNPFTTVTREDIGIKLKIKPQVSEGGAITLQVSQEVSSIDATVNTSGTGIATKKRSIDNKVLVDDGQIIVLGGLIENKVTQTDSKVPLLGDIPLLGNLFRYEKRTNNRTNLMVFLRPVILRDGQGAAALSAERYQLLQDAQIGYQPENRWMLPTLPKVVLPAYDTKQGKAVAPIMGSAPAPGAIPAAPQQEPASKTPAEPAAKP